MAVQKSKRYAAVEEKYCVGCGSCIKACPKNAISVPDGIHAKVALEKCVGCGLCAKACPASVIEIKMTKKEKTDEKQEKELARVSLDTNRSLFDIGIF